MGVVIIPARGGSKRIPRKNIRLFHGKPIISYAIQCAKESQLFDRIIVSTDDQEIASVAQKFGAEVPFVRSTKNADDFATTSDVLLEVLGQLQTTHELPEWACCLYPTTPLLIHTDLRNARETFLESNADVLLAATRFDFPIQRAFELDSEKLVHLREPEAIAMRSQDLTPTYHDAGAFYFFNCRGLMERKSLWAGKVAAFTLPSDRVQDIDTLSDWRLAEYKYQQLHPND
jgi:N-acylneuraminate cytidylyltransferase